MTRTNTIGANDAQEAIVRGAKYLHDFVGQLATQLENASDAGATFAAVVYAYVDDPESIGIDALRAAYKTFMGQHSAGFTTSAREAATA